jgi:hypothetical protein
VALGLVYLVLVRTLSWLALLARSDTAKDAEMTRPTELPEHDRRHLDELLASCRPLTVLAEHVRAFADLMYGRAGFALLRQQILLS